MPVTRIHPADLKLSSSISPLAELNDKTRYHLALGADKNDTGNGVGIAFSRSTGQRNIGAAVIFERTGINSAGELQFYTKQTTDPNISPVHAATIDSSGNLIVRKPSAGDSALDLIEESGSSPGSSNGFGTTDAFGFRIVHDGGTNELQILRGQNTTVNTSIKVARSTGNVFLVDTAGHTTVTSANLFINDSTGFLARSTSDRRGKKDITTITSTLEDLCRLVPRYFYDVNDENSEVKIAGFVADEVEAVFPELVPERKRPSEIYRSVSYDRLGAYIVSALKEIKQRLEDLENDGD